MIRILLVIFFIVCSCSETKVIELNNDIGLGCIRQAPIETEQTELYDLKPVELTNLFPPFTKKLQVCGITLVARDDVSNSFMENIGKTVKEIFIINDFTDTVKQQELLIQLFKYKTLIPLFYDEDWSLNFEEEKQLDLLTKQNSMCDIIMEGVNNQTMEVVEHILHHISDIGLHYMYPEQWGLSEHSKLYTETQKAISKEYYDIGQYYDIKNQGVRNRVILQEYAYWIIYTSWDLRNTYGPEESEWSIFSKEEFSSKLEGSYSLFLETIPSVMTCPSDETLNLFLGNVNS